MGSKKSVVSILSIDLLILLFSAIGVYFLSIKADIPFLINSSDSKLILNSEIKNLNQLVPGVEIISIDDRHFTNREEVEVLLDGKNIGDEVAVAFLKNNSTVSYRFSLIRFYSTFYIISVSLVGLLFILIALVVYLKSNEKRPALVFHWVSIATGMTILMTWGNYNSSFQFLAYLNRIIFHAAYVFVPPLFVLFTLVYPREKKFSKKTFSSLSFIISLLLCIYISIKFFHAAALKSTLAIEEYINGFNFARLYLVVCIIAAFTIFVFSYRTSKSEIDKKKLKWLLYGFIIGPLSFITLWVIPQGITSYSLIPEEIMILLISAVPITFGISIIKYHLLDIDYLINRSVVYSIVIVSLLLLYIGSLVLINDLLHEEIPEKVSAIISAAVIAVLFQPAKTRVQKFVDRKFFRVQYDFRRAINEFLEELKEINTISSLAEKIVERTDKLIPVKKIGFFLLNPDNRIKLIAHKNYDILVGRSLRFESEKLKTNLSLPVAVESKIEPGVNIESADVRVFSRWEMCLVFPVKSAEGEIFAFIVLGEKRSDRKFTAEDVDLLNTVASRAASTFERIKLQEELIREHLEAERLEELNKLKSFFVSRVSHDFKTPLTSIKMFSEILQQSKDLSEEKRKEYLKIIEGESEKLAMLINNVLDFSKIEKGAKEYCFEEIDLNESVKNVLFALQYQFKMQKFIVEKNLCRSSTKINADRMAVEEAIINLIINAMKYSGESRKIGISTLICENHIALTIEDKGIGISEQDLKNIFDPFFRSKDIEAKKVSGTGLGLAIVKHVMDAHKGFVEIKSELSKGTCVTLNFPIVTY